MLFKCGEFSFDPDTKERERIFEPSFWLKNLCTSKVQEVITRIALNFKPENEFTDENGPIADFVLYLEGRNLTVKASWSVENMYDRPLAPKEFTPPTEKPQEDVCLGSLEEDLVEMTLPMDVINQALYIRKGTPDEKIVSRVKIGFASEKKEWLKELIRSAIDLL